MEVGYCDLYFFIFLLFKLCMCNEYSFCVKEDENCSEYASNRYLMPNLKRNCYNSVYVYFRYLFYDVNPPEGFNLRRDVYIRYAVFAHKLQTLKHSNIHNFKLVLPPWSNLYHWKPKDDIEPIPWSVFFDLSSLQLFAPVIEMHQFFNGNFCYM